jgi:ATP-binding cassette subfamily F protein 3
LAYLMMKKYNVLLLDEPTNHLDLESIHSLTQALIDFMGTVILVSHDRTFIDSAALRIIAIDTNNISDFLGTYSEFVANRERDYLDAHKESLAQKNLAAKNYDGKNSYEEQKKRRAEAAKLKRDLDKTMLTIESIENKIADMDQQFATVNFFMNHDFHAIKSMEEEKQTLINRLNHLIKEWEEIEARLQNYEE